MARIDMKQTQNIDIGSDFSGVGALDQSLKRLKIPYNTVFACDIDKYARQSYIANYGKPQYHPFDVYDRLIPDKSLDIYMTSPPCQAFSLAGKRKGENDKRGILFYNSYEFITKNKPRYFIFENVKGLLSDNDGNTFNNWINLLGGKSVNGNPVMFPISESTPYHIYYKVLNAKHHGIPQNRERIFIVGIRDDGDNCFSWPKQQFLTKKLKDVLENDVDEKYYLSDKMVANLIKYNERQMENNTGFSAKFRNIETTETMDTIKVGSGKDDLIKVGFMNQDTQASKVISDEGISSTLSAGTHGYAQGYIQVKSANKKGYEVAKEGDSINLTQPNSETRRGRVGKEVSQTLDTSCNQCVLVAHVSRSITNDHRIRRLTPRECFRLMGFPEDFKFVVSDSQLYKQAGNSIVVNVLSSIIEKLNLT